MNTKHQVISGIIGGIVGSIITALVVSSGTAQRDKFGDIECTSLRVVDADGNARVILSTDVSDGLREAKNIRVRIIGSGGPFGSNVSVLDEDGLLDVILGTDYEHNGFVVVHGKDRKSQAELNIDEDGGRITAYGKDGKTRVRLGIAEHGGFVDVHGKDETWGASLGIDEDGGAVLTRDKFGNVKTLD